MIFLIYFHFFFSFAIAQSAVLAIFEARIEKKTEDYRYDTKIYKIVLMMFVITAIVSVINLVSLIMNIIMNIALSIIQIFTFF